jgi:hypothetical protein
MKVTIPRFSLSTTRFHPPTTPHLKPLISGISLQYDSARDAQSDGSPRMVTSTPPTVDHDSFGKKKSSDPPKYAPASGVDQLLCSDCPRFLRRLVTQRK